MALRGTVKYVMNAVHVLKEAKGATMKQIVDFIADVRGGFDKFAVRKALDQCVAKGTLKLANGKYKSTVDESGLPRITGARRRTRRGRKRRSRSGRRRRRRSRMMPEEAMSGRRGRRRRRRSRRSYRRKAEPDLQQNAQGTTGDPENGQKDENDEVQT